MGPLERREVFEAALARMMSHPHSQLPFVILQCEQTGAFVQFRGSTTETLLFDVPQLEQQFDYGPAAQADFQYAARSAFETLYRLQQCKRAESGMSFLPVDDITLIESVDESERQPN